MIVGLALLAGVAKHIDVRSVRTLGLLSRHFGGLAIRILREVPGAVGDLVWLAERSDPWRHAQAVEALCVLAEPTTFDWLLQYGVRLDGPSITTARRIAETINVIDRLVAHDICEDVVEQVGRLRTASATCRSVRFSTICNAVTNANRPGDQPGVPRSANATANCSSANNSPNSSRITTGNGARHPA